MTTTSAKRGRVVARAYVIRCACSGCARHPDGPFYLTGHNRYPTRDRSAAREFVTVPAARRYLETVTAHGFKVYRRGRRSPVAGGGAR